MINFTKKERTIIAEFVYSYGSDLLIMSDCIRLIEVFATHKLIENKQELLDKVNKKSDDIALELITIVHNKISSAQGDEIMSEYYGIPI